MGCCLDRKSTEDKKSNKAIPDPKIPPKSNQITEIIIEEAPAKEAHIDSTHYIPEINKPQEDEEIYKLHLKKIKDLKQVIQFQKEKIIKLEAEVDKMNKKECFDDEDILTSQTIYIGYLEKAKEELEQKLQNSGNYSQEDIARLILERDQMINNYNTMQNDYKSLLEHYATLYNQYLIMTGQSQEKLD